MSQRDLVPKRRDSSGGGVAIRRHEGHNPWHRLLVGRADMVVSTGWFYFSGSSLLNEIYRKQVFC